MQKSLNSNCCMSAYEDNSVLCWEAVGPCLYSYLTLTRATHVKSGRSQQTTIISPCYSPSLKISQLPIRCVRKSPTHKTHNTQ